MLSFDNEPHLLCVACWGKECNIDDKCGDCHDWKGEMWHKVSSYHSKLAMQRERKKERKAKAASSHSSFSGFSPSMPVPHCELSSSLKSVLLLLFLSPLVYSDILDFLTNRIGSAVHLSMCICW